MFASRELLRAVAALVVALVVLTAAGPDAHAQADAQIEFTLVTEAGEGVGPVVVINQEQDVRITLDASEPDTTLGIDAETGVETTVRIEARSRAAEVTCGGAEQVQTIIGSRATTVSIVPAETRVSCVVTFRGEALPVTGATSQPLAIMSLAVVALGAITVGAVRSSSLRSH